ncbi:hypothetical protein RJ639_028531 [Escallonia herrerae]|uniref:Vacuolar ATPase assembly protein VMA22 n=1 Tax=Escallonia herrerae TaxID=1293975 RepID=A0AA88X557_9ASTE|nr:hypothetical protein RJ639_028531 [Escallonia herrerae]
MGQEEEKGCSENGVESKEEEQDEQENNVLRFLDSLDSYLVLMDSLSSTLRQGWMELASARHSMGASRLNSALFDLKHHNAATSLEVNHHDDTTMQQTYFNLCKWASPDTQNLCSKETKLEEGELLQRKASSPQIRHRGASRSSVTVDDQVQKERSKSLSVFGALVSPKLRGAQLSFETALETLVEIANIRSSILCTHDQVQEGMKTMT